MYWVYDGTNFMGDKPHPISDYGLPDYLDKIDAAFNWDRNRKI